MRNEMQLRELLNTFEEELKADIERAKRSNCLSEEILKDENAGALFKVVLQITAKRFKPMSEEYKAELRNLEKFI